MRNCKPKKYSIVLAFALIFTLLFPMLFLMGTAYPENIFPDEKFKSLGIIKLSGIAPPFDRDLMDLDGDMVKLSDFKGKIIFINFWTTWCPDCVYEMPDIEKLHKKISNEKFIILAIDLKESKKKVEKFVKKHNLTYKILLDKKGDMGRAFGIRSIPTTFILNRQGGLIGKAMGARSWDNDESVSLFKYLLEH